MNALQSYQNNEFVQQSVLYNTVNKSTSDGNYCRNYSITVNKPRYSA